MSSGLVGKFFPPYGTTPFFFYQPLTINYSINKLDPKCKKILRLLRLRQLHNGVFVKLNKATINMVRRVEPYVTYGYPSQATIRKIIYKRGYGKVNNCRIPLVENSIIEN